MILASIVTPTVLSYLDYCIIWLFSQPQAEFLKVYYTWHEIYLLDLNHPSLHFMQYTAIALNCMQKWIDSYFVGPQGADKAIWHNSLVQHSRSLMSNAIIRLTIDPMTISWLPKLVLSHQNLENPHDATYSPYILSTGFLGMLLGNILWGILSLLVYQVS